MNDRAGWARRVIPCVYFVLLMPPIYWLLNMSLRLTPDILTRLEIITTHPTLENYLHIFRDPTWYVTYWHSLEFVALNVLISVSVALPAAYAFSRYRFLGDKQVFFWLLTNRMSPPAVFLLPFYQFYQSVGLFDTPLAVWILEGFMSGVPRELDETAALDGYSFPRFFLFVFLPLIRAGVGVTAFFCFMFSWVELLMASNLASTAAKPIVSIMTRTESATGLDFGLLAAAGVLTIVPGAVVIWFIRNYIAKGFALGRV